MKRLLLFICLSVCAAAQGTFSGGTIGGNILPDQSGRTIGNSTYRWDGYFNNLNMQSLGGIQMADTTSVATALANACSGSIPGVLYLAAGTATVSPLTIPSNCTIDGLGRGTLKLADGTNSGYLVSASSASNITLRNLTLDGNSGNQSPTGLQRTGCAQFTAVSGLTIDNVECKNAYHHGFQVLGASSRITFKKNYVHDNTNGSGIIVGNSAVGDIITDVTIADNIVGPTTGANCIFTTGYNNSSSYGISRVSILGNKLSSCGDVGIEVGVGTQDATVVGNEIQMPASSGHSGIMARGSRNVTIGPNTVNGQNQTNEDAVFVWGNTPTDSTIAQNIQVGGVVGRNIGRRLIDVSAANSGDVDTLILGFNSLQGGSGSYLTLSTNATNVYRGVPIDGTLTSSDAVPLNINVTGSTALSNPEVVRNGVAGWGWHDTSTAVDAGGRWRWVLSSGHILLNDNTASAGDYSTSNSWIDVSNAGLVTIPGTFKIGGSGSTISDSRELLQSVHACGSTSTCANTANGANREVWGTVTLSTGAATLTGITAFTSTSSFGCSCTDQTAANACKAVPASTTSVTFAGTGSDVLFYRCVGN